MIAHYGRALTLTEALAAITPGSSTNTDAPPIKLTPTGPGTTTPPVWTPPPPPPPKKSDTLVYVAAAVLGLGALVILTRK